MDEPPDITATDLKCRLDAGEPLVLLDVREPHERSHCAIPAPPTAIDLHVPLGEIPARLDVLRARIKGPVVVYCHLGIRSRLAANWMAARGFSEVSNLDGGIDAWSTLVDTQLPRYA